MKKKIVLLSLDLKYIFNAKSTVLSRMLEFKYVFLQQKSTKAKHMLRKLYIITITTTIHANLKHGSIFLYWKRVFSLHFISSH